MAIETTPQLNPATLGLAQTNTPVAGGRPLGGLLPSLEGKPLINLAELAPLKGGPKGLNDIFQNRKAAQSTVGAAILGARDFMTKANSDGVTLHQGTAAYVTSAAPQQVYGTDFVGHGLGGFGRRGSSFLDPAG